MTILKKTSLSVFPLLDYLLLLQSIKLLRDFMQCPTADSIKRKI
jgi:hypothetical protein